VVQRCDACRTHPGDLEAALAYAEAHGGRVHAIGDGEVFAPQSDPWIMPGEEPGPVVWHSVEEAHRQNWYPAPEED
jgi:hypothetical protein